MSSTVKDIRQYKQVELEILISFLGNYNLLGSRTNLNGPQFNTFSQNFGQKQPNLHQEEILSWVNKRIMSTAGVPPRLFGELAIMTKCLQEKSKLQTYDDPQYYIIRDFEDLANFVSMPNWGSILQANELIKHSIRPIVNYVASRAYIFRFNIDIESMEQILQYNFNNEKDSLTLEVLIGLFLGALKINRADYMYNALKELSAEHFKQFIKKYENASPRDEISEFSKSFPSRTSKFARPGDFR